jgi:hypothetical protein
MGLRGISLAVALAIAGMAAQDARASIQLLQTTPVNWAFQVTGNFVASDLQYFLNTGLNDPDGKWVFVDADPDGSVYNLGGDSLASAYKGNNDGSEAGSFAPYYNTVFQGGNEYGSVNYNGPGTPASIIDFEHMFLIIKDGNAEPNVFVYDLNSLGWDGQEQILMGNAANNLFGARGSISHAEIVVGGDEEDIPRETPEPATLLVWGCFGLIGLAAKRKLSNR